MATLNEQLRDIAIAHAIGVQRLSTGVVNDVLRLLNETDTDLVEQLQRFEPHNVTDRYKRGRVDKLLAAVRKLNKEAYSDIGGSLKSSMKDLAAYEAEYTATTTAGVLGMSVTDFVVPSQAILVAAAVDNPFAGRLLSEWVEGLEAARYDRLRAAIRMSVVQGESIPDAVKRIRGSRQFGYKDGILQMSRRSAETMARTAIGHVVNEAKQATYEENEDVLNGWQWVATLDAATCEECAALDGEVFDVGDATAEPPLHLSCRCTTSPVVKGSDRAPTITYQDWLEQQSAEMQDQALGPTRGKLFREGGMTVKSFVDDLGRGLTLDQLQRIDPQAFEDAGIE